MWYAAAVPAEGGRGRMALGAQGVKVEVQDSGPVPPNSRLVFRGSVGG
jgi:hypothetical protein